MKLRELRQQLDQSQYLYAPVYFTQGSRGGPSLRPRTLRGALGSFVRYNDVPKQEGSMGRKRSIPIRCEHDVSLRHLCSQPGGFSGGSHLSAQYQLAKVRAESGGYAVNTPGTLLTIQQKGVLGVPWKALALCPAKYQDNNFHPSVGFCAGMLKDVSRYFQVGDKVYPVKVEVNVDKG